MKQKIKSSWPYCLRIIYANKFCLFQNVFVSISMAFPNTCRFTILPAEYILIGIKTVTCTTNEARATKELQRDASWLMHH